MANGYMGKILRIDLEPDLGFGVGFEHLNDSASILNSAEI